ncbi:unnamed protein product [Lupinus luteus]|uniref:Uncharacterized protein n=1 Tax=Lupinus luteus TaxID=3873 RepID=A0AAV1WIC4_LUPLU
MQLVCYSSRYPRTGGNPVRAGNIHRVGPIMVTSVLWCVMLVSPCALRWLTDVPWFMSPMTLMLVHPSWWPTSKSLSDAPLPTRPNVCHESLPDTSLLPRSDPDAP